METWVVDCSVAAKWFPPMDLEQFAPQARALLDRWSRGEIQMVAPDLLWAELGNVFWKCVRLNRCSAAEAQASIRLMNQLGLSSVATFQLVEEGLRLAAQHGRTIYDCLYVALAMQARAQLITADEKLVNALGSRYPVRWLGAI